MKNRGSGSGKKLHPLASPTTKQASLPYEKCVRGQLKSATTTPKSRCRQPIGCFPYHFNGPAQPPLQKMRARPVKGESATTTPKTLSSANRLLPLPL